MKDLRILVTGGSGDLGYSLAPLIQASGATMVSLDLTRSERPGVEWVQGTILDRSLVGQIVATSDVIVHVAAWHGYHAFTRTKRTDEFWDTNMTGTFNLLEACVQHTKRKFVFMSSTSVDEWPEIYGMTKALGEDLCRAYATRHAMQIFALRPRAFIPWWNTRVYSSKADWASWFARGAVHIEDVASATIRACLKVLSMDGSLFEAVELDGKQDFNEDDQKAWKDQGREAFLVNRFPSLSETIKSSTFLPEDPPTYKDLTKARELLGYYPKFGYEEMLNELRAERVEGF